MSQLPDLENLRCALRDLIRWAAPPPQPGHLALFNKQEFDMDRWGFKLALPVPGAPDVVSRELSVKVGDAEPVVATLAGDAVLSEQFEADEGATVLVSLKDIDNAGNPSPAREQSFVITDDVAPPEPGELAIAEKVELPST